jgi:hypothetical protein
MHKLGAALVSAIALLLSGRLAATTFIVNSTSDSPDAKLDGVCETSVGNGICTLHAAIQEANDTTGALIRMPATTPGDPILLTMNSTFGIKASMTIEGAGMHATEVSGKTTGTVFYVDKAIPHIAVVTLRSMTIRDGFGFFGGGVSHGDVPGGCCQLDMIDVRVTSCIAASGGGVYSIGPSTLTNCVIDACLNPAGSGPAGGGVYFGGGSGTCNSFPLHIVTGSTISDNTTLGVGGGVFVTSSEVHLVNTTISGNHASVHGGGIGIQGGQTYLENATVTDNRANAASGGGGIYNGSAAAAANFANSIIAGNLESDGFQPPSLIAGDCDGSLTSLGYDIMGPDGASHCSIGGGGVTLADPLLGALQDNGGTNATHALLAGSVAIDGGNPQGCASQLVTLLKDLRGVQRPVGSACDVGAYERAPCGDADGNGAVNVADVFFLINYLFAGGAPPRGLANVNADSATNVSDVFYLINALFAGGAGPSCPGT